MKQSVFRLVKKACTYKCSFEEPLYETVSELSTCYSYRFKVSHSLSEDEVREYATIWNNTTKKLVLVGVNEPRAISDSTIETLAADESVVV
jgi:2-succinyl-5-enolpyruvyl-6-hydroxy-3-cyclohexene-1-carboxylate synthase